MSLATQIIDQQVSGLVDSLGEAFASELRLGPHTVRRRSAAFLFLVARTMFELSEDEIIDGIVDGGDDYGIDALYFDPPEHGEIRIALVQGKYKSRLTGASAFPETAITSMIDAVRVLFDPERTATANERLRHRIEDIRSFVKDGAIPHVRAVAANNGLRWSAQAQERLNGTNKEFGGQVEWQHVGSEELFRMLQQRKPVEAEIQLSGEAVVETFDFRRALTGRMPVTELARLTGEHGDRLFERNIRRYPGLAGNRINEAMARTLREAV